MFISPPGGNWIDVPFKITLRPMARQSDTLDLLEVWGSLLANERMSTLRQGRDRDHEEQFRPIWGVYLFYTWLL